MPALDSLPIYFQCGFQRGFIIFPALLLDDVLQGATPGEVDYRIFSAGLDDTVRLWDSYDMGVIRVLQEERSEISAMTFYEAWNIMVTGKNYGTWYCSFVL